MRNFGWNPKKYIDSGKLKIKRFLTSEIYYYDKKSGSDIQAMMTKDIDPLLMELEPLTIVEEVGFKPDFNICTSCNRLVISEEVVFSIREGAIVCKDCGSSTDNGWKLLASVRKSLSDLQKINHKRLSSASINLDQKFVYTEFLLTYLRYHSDEKLDLSSLKLFK